MKRRRLGLRLSLIAAVCCFSEASIAQQTAPGSSTVSTAATGTVPRVLNYSGTVTDLNGKPLPSITGVTFLLYKEEQGGAPLWFETQNVQPNKGGHYSVTLGSTNSNGLPEDVFVTGEARWLGVQIEGQPEQPRVLLVAVPYALKSGDAETLGGLPASAFLLAAPSSIAAGAPSTTASSPSSTNPPPTGTLNVTTTGGTANRIPMFTTATNIQNSILTQTGTTAVSVGGTLKMPGLGTATAAKGFDSQAQDFVASVYNSTSKTAVAQTFQLQAEPANNDKSTASGTLNLLYGSGALAPTETGFKISNKGIVTFASGQTFPGTGNGTITRVTAGTDLTGGGTSGNVTVNLDTTKVPQLGVINNFTQTLFAPQLTSTGSAEVDNGGSNTGNYVPGLQFGPINSGETIASAQAPGSPNQYGLDFYTAALPRMSIISSGQVGIGGLPSGDAQLEIDSAQFRPWAILGNGYSALFGSGNDGDDGVYGYGGFGDLQSGSSTFGGWGLFGVGGEGSSSDGVGGLFGGGNFSTAGDGVYSNAGSGYAGNFKGNLNVTGAIFAGVKDFKIDHPLDPANKYLLHASVESSEMKNIYDGVVTTDGQGVATVQLPEWFEGLNTDFRYQLTVIGQFAQAIVAREIQNHEFSIRTSAPDVKVSWQVTGVRQDAFAKAHPLVVEEEKEASVKGFYIHPELYGAPAEKQIEWARHPRTMRRMQQQQLERETKQKQARLTPAAKRPVR